MAAVEIILIVALIYAFSGPLSFIFYVIGFLFSLLKFPLTFISFLYPVGHLPYIFLTGVPVFFLALYVIRLFKPSS